ncbi:Lrp/AsnC family transcriptional regulator [Paracoccus aminophilus]|uniref:Transcriptional regulator, AsnC family n=1 Tax=Paracoccus aminophilus JCM 7686 TaxID=1367847 RepID=S5XJ28_PARAH|nr:Lrp/AsnC family transcriptional regulator [Paracoccus aminophilus]AGT07184.1 transcriptional regulator, AsnC family [Paracoccus aminophilus JCM 7686]
MAELDLIDRKIVASLMQDASLSVARLAERVGLSQTPCWKRIQRLESTGIITGRVARVDPVKLGLGLTVFVAVEAADHSADWREHFQTELARHPEIIEAHRLAGPTDYLLRVVVKDMPAFDDFYRRLTSGVPMRNVTSHFAMEPVKNENVLPIDTRNH